MNEHENRRGKPDWKISGFADEISDDLRQQIDGFRRLGISFMEMRGVDGNNLIYHSDEKVREIKTRLDDAGIRLLRPFIAYVHVKDALAENGNVVPAGMGDGHVAEILAELAGAGFDGFLSIEPHLAHFAGFDLLEKNGVSIAKGTPPLEGFDAFELAHRSLLRILDGRTGESHG